MIGGKSDNDGNVSGSIREAKKRRGVQQGVHNGLSGADWRRRKVFFLRVKNISTATNKWQTRITMHSVHHTHLGPATAARLRRDRARRGHKVL